MYCDVREPGSGGHRYKWYDGPSNFLTSFKSYTGGQSAVPQEYFQKLFDAAYTGTSGITTGFYEHGRTA